MFGFARVLVVYYGEPLNRAEILRQKRVVGRRLHVHAYRLVPGTATSACDPSGDHCRLCGVLEWRARHGSGGASCSG